MCSLHDRLRIGMVGTAHPTTFFPESRRNPVFPPQRTLSSAAFGRNQNHISRKKRKKAKKGTGAPTRFFALFCVFFRFFRLYSPSSLSVFLAKKTRCCAFAVQRNSWSYHQWLPSPPTAGGRGQGLYRITSRLFASAYLRALCGQIPSRSSRRLGLPSLPRPRPPCLPGPRAVERSPTCRRLSTGRACPERSRRDAHATFHLDIVARLYHNPRRNASENKEMVCGAHPTAVAGAE